MRGYYLIRTSQEPMEGKLVFQPVIKIEGRWAKQEGIVLIGPDKPMVVVGEYEPLIDEKRQI